MLAEDVIAHYQAMAAAIQANAAQNNQPNQQAQAQQVQRHPQPAVTAEMLIQTHDDNTMKLFTNFTISEFQMLYSQVANEMETGVHSSAALTPKTRFLVTLAWCHFNETYRPMAQRFGLKYTYARTIVYQTIERIGAILQQKYIQWISVNDRLVKNVHTPDYPTLLGAVDATVQEIYRPKQGQRTYYSGKHKRHVLKIQGFVNPMGLLIHYTGPVPGSEHDFSLFRSSNLSDIINDESRKCQSLFGAPAIVLADAGYQGISNIVPSAISPHKKPRNGELSQAQADENRKISHYRIIVENWFGRHKSLWRVCNGKYRQKHTTYKDVWGFCAALTNFHIQLHPLRGDEYRPFSMSDDDD